MSSDSMVTDEIGAVLVAGVPVDDVTMTEAVDLVVQLSVDGRARSVTHQVATVNVDFVVNALRNPELMSILQRTSLSVPDGMPLVWGSRLLGAPLRERVAGADLVAAIVERAAHEDLTVLLYGAGPGIAARAAERLRAQVPDARVIGEEGPPDVSTLSAVDQLEGAITSRPDICCVAFGNPKQELFIDRFGTRLGIPVMIGVGGTLDFLVGEKQRAPRWMQRVGLEWLHRAASEPGRLARRYVRDAFVFVPALVTQAWRGRPRVDAGNAAISRRDGRLVIDLTELREVDNASAARIVAGLRGSRRRGEPAEAQGVDRCDLSRVARLEAVLDTHR